MIMVDMRATLKKQGGMTLIELLVAMVICAILIGAIYRVFISQQKIYAVQQNVVDMQQNARLAVIQMTREIRMAGFGAVATVLPIQFPGGTVTLNNSINLDTPVLGALTIVEAGNEATQLNSLAARPDNQITVSTLTDGLGNALFDSNVKKYVSIDGLECHEITSIDSKTNTITLKDKLLYRHEVGTPVFAVRVITYQVVRQNGEPLLTRDENTGEGGQVMADNVESVQFGYYDAAGNLTTNVLDARTVGIFLIARTAQSDPDLKGGDGYRRRNISTFVQLKDMVLDQQQGGV
ncbi:MAG: prepilin-type N-terminal cleavage/methylation domain-containing protein [Thermodesulfobacteriota bacterium]|jgi:prepilin-type N-terminal cleavage/methylation domain-containing protein